MPVSSLAKTYALLRPYMTHSSTTETLFPFSSMIERLHYCRKLFLPAFAFLLMKFVLSALVIAQAPPRVSPAPIQQKVTAPAQRKKCKLAGKIVTSDKVPAKTKGWLYYHTKSSTGVVSEFTDSFSFETEAGEIWLTYFSEGHAPAWTEKMVFAPGQIREDITLTLHDGDSHRLKLTDDAGKPVANATVIPLVNIHNNAGGPIHSQQTNEKGEILLEHLAAAPYSFRINAAGYEPLRTAPSNLAKSLSHTLVRCKPTTGKILLSDGTPAKGAKLRLLAEKTEGQGFDSPGNDNDGFWGKCVATSDEKGNFTLDQLTQSSSYLFLAEAVDGSRVLLHTLRADQKDVAIHIPARLDLQLKIQGDLKLLPERNGKPFLSIRQSIDFRPNQQSSFGALIGADCYVESTPDGCIVTFHGLAVDTQPLQAKQQVKIDLGKTTKTIELNAEGLTEDTITLDASL
ncbi:MAG: hypothetical protein ACO1RA_14990 [Planctomycetaceae bacterium]